MVRCSIKPCVNKYLGLYSSLEETNKDYIKAKAQVLANEFKNITDIKIKNGLYEVLLNLIKENKILISKL